MEKLELAIVGAGPAGLSTAIDAAARGMRVAVFERRDAPLDKACGEGLLPPAVRELARLGVGLPSWGRHVVTGIRYIDGDRVADGRFRTGPALGVRRLALAEALRARAAEVGVAMYFGARVLGWEETSGGLKLGIRSRPSGTAGSKPEAAIHARVLIGADGLHSTVARQAGLVRDHGAGSRFGIRRHYAIAPWGDQVEVHWADGIEAYVTPVGPELVGVALLWKPGRSADRAHAAGSEAQETQRASLASNQAFDRLLQAFPLLEACLAGAPHASEVRGAGPFPKRPVRAYRGSVALVGDAAGYIDPLTGEGVSLALSCAKQLVDALVTRGDSLRAYGRAHRALFRHYALVTRAVLMLTRRPALRRRIISTLADRPDLFDALLAVAAAEAPIRRIGPRGLALLGRALIL